MERPDWRSRTADEELNLLERPGFAWAFLHRNKTYRAAYERMSRQDPRIQ
jgi:hypothetical protein